MKLPEFRTSQDQTSASRSTSMSGAFMDPQIRPMTMAHKAAQHNVMAGQQSMEAASNAAMAKYGVGTAIAEGVGAMIEMHQKIDTANQTAAAESAKAKYSQHMSMFAAQEQLTGGQIDPDTNLPRHYGYAERYAAEKERITAEIRAENKFSQGDLVHKFGLSVNAADSTNGEAMMRSGFKHQIEEAKGKMMEARFNAPSYAKKIEITDQMIALDLLPDSQGAKDKDKYRTSQKVEAFYAGVMSDPTAIQSEMHLQALNDPMAIDVFGGIENVNRMRKRVLDNKANALADSFFGKANAHGSKEVLNDGLAAAMSASHEELGVTNEFEKQEILKRLEGELTSRKKILIAKDKESLVNQKYQEDYAAFERILTAGGPTTYNHLPGAQASYEAMNKEIYTDHNISMMDAFELDHDNHMKLMGATGVLDKQLVKELQDSMNGDAGAKKRAAGMIMAIAESGATVTAAKLEKALGEDVMDQAAAYVANPGRIQADADKQKLPYAGKKAQAEFATTLVQAGNKTEKGISLNVAEITSGFESDKWFGRGFRLDIASAQVMEPEYRRHITDIAGDGTYHGDVKAIKAAAMRRLKRDWAVEVREDGTQEPVKGSFYRAAGSVDGRPTENALSVIHGALEREGKKQYIEPKEGEVLTRQVAPVDGGYQMFHRTTVDGVPTEQPILGADNFPIVINESELALLNSADENKNKNAMEGEFETNELLSTLTEGSEQAKNREGFYRAVGSIWGVGEEAYKSMLSTADSVTTVYIDALRYLVEIQPHAAKELDVNLFLNGGGMMGYSPKANDIMWNRAVAHMEASYKEANAKNPGTIKNPKQSMAKFKATLELRFGLTPPALNYENPSVR